MMSREKLQSSEPLAGRIKELWELGSQRPHSARTVHVGPQQGPAAAKVVLHA